MAGEFALRFYSILSPNETTKNHFSFIIYYNLFPAVNLFFFFFFFLGGGGEMCCFVHTLRFLPSRLVRKNMLEHWTKTSSVGGLQIR